ncbi:MAG: tRNA (cytidine(56)-2'-O)-methyltransferase [Candidatus Aenigmarchaeota archaeon]|nr:tRNA (cytidine(56)-2'-O)-methyltransferase [Candidatus Aenigmarchaeota archaeon]
MIAVLRLGHRPFRDSRVSTHCALIARAFGADKLIYSGEHDQKLEDSINKVTDNWGGPFKIEHTKSALKTIKDFKKKNFKICHLTVYGLPIQNEIGKIRKYKNILIIIGGSKVPGEIYQLADFNIGVTQQPHSEMGSLCIFLDRYFEGKELNNKFNGWKMKVIPNENKKIIEKKK